MKPNSPSRDKLSRVRCFPLHGRLARFSVLLVAFVSISVVAYNVVDRLNLFYGFPERPFYSVVVDCGSTGTRVNVYKWETRAGSSGSSRKHLPVLLHSYPDDTTKDWKSGCKYHCMQTEPGLDRFVGNFSGIRASLEPLIHWAEGVVPRERHHETPILVLATAGLRSLPAKDEECVLEDVRQVIKHQRFAYRTSSIRVLSGKEEAYYGWVALNYKLGILQSSSPLSNSNTLVLADLGGSSLQVVMEVEEMEDDDRILRSDIGGRRNELLAVSIPEFGLNEAYDRSVAMLSAETQGARLGSEVGHPCLGPTFVQNHTCRNCLEQRSKLSRLVHVVGDPNMELCLTLVQAVALNASISGWSKTRTLSSCKQVSTSRDGMTPLGIPFKSDPNMRVHALSGFFAVYNKLDLPGRAKMTEMWSKAQILCSRLWTDEESFHGDMQQPDCFKAMYMLSLIRDALCFMDSSDIVFGPADVSWALGASLVEHDSFDTGTGDTLSGILSSMKHTEFLLSSVPLFIVLLLVLCFVYHYQVKLPMTQRKDPSLALAPAPPVLSSYNILKQRPQ